MKELVAAFGTAMFIAGIAMAADTATTSSTKATPTAAALKVVAVAPVPVSPPPATTTKTSAVPVSTRLAATVPVAITTPAILKPLDLIDMRIWNWNAKWLASEWDNANGPIPWRYNHITQPSKADTTFRLDAAGAPQLQALNGSPAYANGLWESEVTLPKLRDGLIVAPLWIYDPVSKDEVDFEYAGRYGLDVSLHAVVSGVARRSTVRLFAGTDMSGQRKRFSIRVDQTAGTVDMYVDSKFVHRFDRSKVGFFLSHPMKPFIEMAPLKATSGFVQWAGKWNGLAASETLKMVVHGYGYSALGK